MKFVDVKNEDLNKHNLKKEKLIAYDNASIAEQDERGKLIAAQNKGKMEGKKEGRIEGKKEGKKEGAAAEKEEVVARCWQKKMAIADIAEISGLTIEAVKGIIAKFKKGKENSERKAH